MSKKITSLQKKWDARYNLRKILVLARRCGLSEENTYLVLALIEENGLRNPYRDMLMIDLDKTFYILSSLVSGSEAEKLKDPKRELTTLGSIIVYGKKEIFIRNKKRFRETVRNMKAEGEKYEFKRLGGLGRGKPRPKSYTGFGTKRLEDSVTSGIRY